MDSSRITYWRLARKLFHFGTRPWIVFGGMGGEGELGSLEEDPVR